jgi:hypothetical protein
MAEKKRQHPQGGAVARVCVAATLRGIGQRWGGGSPVGASVWGVGGSGLVGGDNQSRLGGGQIGWATAW